MNGKTQPILEIRYLHHGLIKAPMPDGFYFMTPKEKLEWADKCLEHVSDKDLVTGMSTFEHPEKDGVFSEPPIAAAVEEVKKSKLVEHVATEEWHKYCSGRNIVTQEK